MYKIVATTNGYIASRDAMFRGKTEVVLYSNLTLNQAYNNLLSLYNDMFERSAPNWGIAVIQSIGHDGAIRTHSDGTREFSYDSRNFKITQ